MTFLYILANFQATKSVSMYEKIILTSINPFFLVLLGYPDPLGDIPNKME